MNFIRRFRPGFRWEEVDLLDYKPAGSHFRDVSRQQLFAATAGLHAELRYFEIAPGGHSTLECHDHEHALLILRGEGRVLVGEEVERVGPFDLVSVPPGIWHQFRAAAEVPLGFLCLVADPRDRPRRPTGRQLELMRKRPRVASFIRV